MTEGTSEAQYKGRASGRHTRVSGRPNFDADGYHYYQDIRQEILLVVRHPSLANLAEERESCWKDK